ncbi:MAG: hypothetical protein HWD91_08745 [Marivivens sp.]|nr:hypothetical protein [Marivivens sp.]
MHLSILIAATLTAVVMLPSDLHAQDASSCVSIENAEQRLQCFDQAFATPEEPATPELESDWSVTTDVSPLDDSKSVYLSVTSASPIMGRYGRLETGTLYIRCFENTTSLFTVWGGHFMSDNRGGGRVDYRIDDNPAAHVSMQESSDNEALGLWNGGVSIPFIKRLFGGETIFMRASPFNESPVEMTFNISGLEQAIEPLREACRW